MKTHVIHAVCINSQTRVTCNINQYDQSGLVIMKETLLRIEEGRLSFYFVKTVDC